MVNLTGKANPDNAKALPRIQAMAAAGHSYGAIALAVGMSRNRVIGLARRHGISNGNPPPEYLTPSGKAKAAEMRKVKSLAREAKLSSAQRDMRADKAAKQSASQPASQSSGARVNRGDAAIRQRNQRIAQAYHDGRSADELAREHGLSTAYIRTISSHMGLSPRLRSKIKPMASECYPAAWGCQWIEGDPKQHDGDIDALKCSQARVTGRPYCAAHCLRAYNGAALSDLGATESGSTESGAAGAAA